MRRTLHILKDPQSREALEIIGMQMEPRPNDSAVLLIQEAVRLKPNFPVQIYVLDEDAESRGVVPGKDSIDYARMLEMILGCDSVVVW